MKFATLASLAGVMPTMLLYVLGFGAAAAVGFSQRKGAVGAGEVAVVAVLVPVVLVLVLASQVAGLFFNAALDHLGLMLVGAQPKSYQVTVRANALAMGPYVVGLLPVCSLYVFPLWSLGLRVLANAHLHRITIGRAAAGVLLPTVAFCGVGLAGYAALIVFAGSMGR